MTDPTLPQATHAVPPQALLDAIGHAGPALALAGADGCLLWCTAAFTALFAAPTHAGQTLHALLGDTGLASLDTGGLEVLAPAAAGAKAPWRLRAAAAANGSRVISAEPLAALRAAEAFATRLQERLDMVQDFSDTGTFERDAVTMVGSWDRHMYRIYGLPARPPGEPAPSYAETSSMIFSDDRKQGAFRATLTQPGPHVQRIRIRRPDGRVRHLHTQWKVLHDEQGRAQRVLGINTDDTDVLELAERAALLHTELEVALKLGRIALWRHDLASGRMYLDERGSEVVGLPFSAAGVTLEQARARIHPDDRASVLASAQHTLSSGEPSDMELRYPRAGGGWRYVLLRRALQRDREGQVTGFVGVLLDVTDRVEESHRAQDNARRLEAAAEAARVGLWSTQHDKPLPSWSRRMYELFGLDPQGGPLTLDDWVQRCVHEADRARVRQAVGEWWHRGQGEAEFEFRVVRPADGALRWLVVRGKLDAVGDDKALRAEGVAMDVTEHHGALRQLRETVERMTLTTRALGLGTWTIEIGQKLAHWDAQMFKLRGVDSPARQISADEIPTYLHPEDRTPVLATQMERLNDVQPWHHVFRVQWPDGPVRWITSHSVLVFDDQGRPDGRIGVNWDSTEAHLTAQAVREREVAVAESQAKSQAMSRISHELRTPLNAVLGFTQLLRGAEAAERPESTESIERRARWLAHIEDAGRHLLALIDDVLELTSAEVGELKLVTEAVACTALVQAALPLVAGMAQDSAVVLRREALEGVMLADPVRLRQVLINLLSNAIKYNRRGGEVRVWSRRHGATVALHVADTGPGIAPERLRHAFEPFNRLGAEATGVEGHGIGLAIVKVLVESMGGRVEAHSQPGRGSEFIVHLPAAPEDVATALEAAASAAAAAADPGSLAPRNGAARVLYIEDNAVNALLVREMLAHRPAVELDVAEDGLSGVQRARGLLPDLILIDMQLPDIDGHAVLRALRADPLTAAIRCVALSANATPADLEAARLAGFADYWTKPIDLRRFLEHMDSFLGRPG